MKSISAPPGGFPMQALRLAFMTPALCLGDLLLDTPVEMSCKQSLPITGGRRIL
jgi:hypothetical protein